MLFNSVEFLLFFLIVTPVYFLLPYRFRWVHLLTASCFFYMTFVPVYIFILFFTIIVDYTAGIMIEGAEGKRRWLFLLLSLAANIGVLAVFKYYNFFTENINALLHAVGIQTHSVPYLSMILPIGLSFHTFQAMSYTIEVYRGNQSAEKHFGIYALYVMFYPQLVAGPIERPQNLLHQFREKYDLDYVRMRSGFLLMLWGFFQKVVIADRLALYVDPVYGHIEDFHGARVWVASFFYAFQIYCDFSGYTDIARGAARMMGFELMKNFQSPFVSKNITEFWRRWHISLSTWFNDYLFKPFVVKYRDWGDRALVWGLMLTFGLSGLWHGAGWNFVIFGLLHGGAMTFEFLTRKRRSKISKSTPRILYNSISRLLTFCFLVFAWVFFRSANLHQAFIAIRNALDFTQPNSFKIGFFKADAYDITRFTIIISPILIGAVTIASALQYKISDLEKSFFAKPFYLRWATYYGLLACIFELGVFSKNHFIYFQF